MNATDAILDRVASTLGNEAPPTQDSTGEAILDATLETLAAVGLSNLSLDAIARLAKCNRATIYRRFGDRDGLLTALAEREAHRMATAFRRSVEGVTDPEELICEAFVASVELAISHPLVDRARRHEPAALLRALAIDGSHVLRIGGAAVSLTLRHAAAQGRPPRLDPDAAGLVAARLLASFLLVPGPDLSIGDPDEARRYAREVLVPLLLDSSRP